MPNIENFICSPCTEIREAASKMPKNIKHCPNCNAPTEKNGGCNHITCHCNTHWCWTCNTAHPRATIYDHMSLCGGIFPRDLAPEDVDYEYNEEDDD
jgi:hypothetical protein